MFEEEGISSTLKPAFSEENSPSEGTIELTFEERSLLTKAINIAREGRGIPENMYQRLIENKKTAALIKHVYFDALGKNQEFRKFRKRMIKQAIMNYQNPRTQH